jgi:uncharacterized protein YprB with RNaseH-like and TPR domain
MTSPKWRDLMSGPSASSLAARLLRMDLPLTVEFTFAELLKIGRRPVADELTRCGMEKVGDRILVARRKLTVGD